MIVTAVKPGLRGELTRWMLEPQAGTFVGNPSARIRDRLWEKVCSEVREGSAVLVHTARTEQGFALRVHGDRTRIPVDHEGITLIKRRLERKRKPTP